MYNITVIIQHILWLVILTSFFSLHDIENLQFPTLADQQEISSPTLYIIGLFPLLYNHAPYVPFSLYSFNTIFILLTNTVKSPVVWSQMGPYVFVSLKEKIVNKK